MNLHILALLEQPEDGVYLREQKVTATLSQPMAPLSHENYSLPNVLHLVVYQNHFVPLLNSKRVQREKLSQNSPETFLSSSYQKNKMVDPATGQPRQAENAISYAAFKQRQKKVNQAVEEKSRQGKKRSLAVEVVPAAKKQRITAKKASLVSQNENNHLMAHSSLLQVAPADELSDTLSGSSSEKDLSSNSNSSGGTSLPAASTMTQFGLFAVPPTIKPEASGKSIVWQSVVEQLRKTIKTVRRGNNAQYNCGYLTHYTMQALRELLQGEKITSFAVPQTSSLTVTPNEVAYHFVPIKAELRGETE